MPLDNEKLKKVYSTLKEGGYDQDYNTFVKGFSGNENYGNRKQVYDLLTQNGAQVGKDYAEFMQKLYTPSPKQTQVQQPRVNRGSMVRAVTDPLNARGIGGMMQNIKKVQGVVKKAEKEKANGYQQRFDGVTKRNTEAKIPTLADMKPMPTFEPTPHFETEKGVDADGKIVSKAKPKQIFDGSGQPKYVYQDSFTGKTYDPNDNDPHTQEMIKRGEDVASYVQEAPMAKVTDKDLIGLASDIDKRMHEIALQRNAEAGTSDWSGLDMPRGGGALVGNWYTSTQNGLLADEEYKTLGIAQGALARAHKMVEEAEKSKREGNFSGFIKGAGRGFVDGVFDPETWDFGVLSLAEAGYIKNALGKFDSGQRLSKDEKILLDAKAMEMAVNAFYGSDLGRGYKAGKVTAEAIPFMIEMMINPASGAGKSAASMLTRYALKRFGKKGLVKASKKAAEKAFVRAEERALAKGLSKSAAKAAGERAAARATTQTLKFQAAKTGARVLGDVAGASAMAATTGAMRTAADAVSRHSGDVKFDVDDKGNIVFAGHDKGDDWGTAVKKAFANTAIENYSELFGAYFAPIGSFVGKAGEKLLSKLGLGKVTEMLGKLSSSDIAKAVKRIEEKGQFNGVIGEDLEEQVGGIMNALIVGDQTLDTADGTGVFNTDNQIDTFLGVGLMGGIFSAARLGGGLVGGQGNLEARRAVRQAGVAALEDFKGKELIWDQIKSDVDNASNDQLKQVVKNIVTDGGLSDENKKAALQYVRSSMYLRGVDAIRPLTKEEEEADAHNVQEEAAHNRGFEADAQERKDIAIESADPNNAEAQQAWAAVEQRINDDATQMAEALREKALQTQHTDGSFHTGTLKEKDEQGEGKQVFIVSGHVQMTPDGTMIDHEASDKTIIIFDPSTGERKMIDPSSDFGLSSVDEPTTSEELDASIERNRQGFIQAQLDEARGTIRLSVGQQFVLPDGNEAVVVALDESGEDITAMLADGTQVNIQRAELQQAHDEQALAEYRQRKGIEEPTAEDEGPEQSEQGVQVVQVEGAPSSYEPDMELVVRNENGGESQAIVMGRVRYEGGEFVPDENGGIVEYFMDGEVRHEQIGKLNDRVVSHTDAAQVIEEEEPPAEDVQTEEETPLQEEESVPAEKDTTLLDEEELAPAAEEDAKEDNAMPMRDNGEEDWEATTPERAHTYIYNEAGLSQREGNEFVAAQKDAAQRALNKAKSTQAPRVGTSIRQYNEAKAKHQEKIENAQRVLDYWNAVQDIQVAIQHKEREQKEAEDAKAHEEAAAQMQADFEERKAAEAERAAVGNENPMPTITEKWSNAEKVDGYSDEIVLPDGTSLKGHYVLHESGVSSPSHNAETWKMTEGFPMDANDNSVNDRDYENDKDAQAHTEEIARNYDQRALQSVPVVSRDGVVLSGNGRTMAGELAARDNTDKAYIDYLKAYAHKFGFTPEQVEAMEHPRVSFVPDEAMPYTAETFARFNQQEMKSQSKTEQAVKLGKTVSDDAFRNIVRTINGFDTLGDFYNDPQESIGAVYDLHNAGVIPQTQLAEMVDGIRGQERLSAVGREYLENMLIGKAFSNEPDVLRMLTAEPAMRQTIITALGEIVDNIALGEDWALQGELADAVKLCFEARKDGAKYGDIVSAFASQGVLFADPDQIQTKADFRNVTMLMLADALNDKRVTLLKTTLQLYNNEARLSASGQADMFAGGIQSREDILRNVINYIKENYGKSKEIEAAKAEAMERRKAESLQEDGDPGTSIVGVQDGAEQTGVLKEDEDSQGNVASSKEESPTDFTPSPRKDGEDLLDYAARVNEESKADHKRKQEEAKVNTLPSDAQKEAGNYKKGHIKVDGMDITIEQPKGSIRTGKDASGKEWHSEMHNTYGYIRGTESVDGDHIDIFLSDNPADGNVFVVDQVNKDGSFDEHKVMYGFTDIESAKQAYLSNYEKGWQGLGNITEVSKDEFKKWIDSSKRKTKPFAEYTSVKTQDDMQTKKPTEAEDFTRQDLKELEDFQKNTDTTGRTAIDIDRYDAEDLFAPLKLDGKQSNLGVLTVVSDKITDPASQIAVYDYSDEIDDKTNSGWQKWGDLADEYNKTVDKDDKAQERGDTATLGFRTVDAAVKFNDWLNTSTQTERTEEAQTDVAAPAMTEEEYLASKGLGSPMSDHMLDKTRIPHGETARQKARREREAEKAMKEHAARKKDARKEYQEKLANGELREPTKEETEKKRIDALIRTANGHEDNPSVLAARRVLDKRGIDWQKKDGQINTQTEENNAHNSEGIMREQKNVQLQQTTTTITNDTEAKQEASESEDIRFRQEERSARKLAEVNERFNRELAELTEKNAQSKRLKLGKPSLMLSAAGVPDKPIILYGNKLLKKAKLHNFDVKELHNLPLAMQNPIAVFEGSHPNSFATLLEIKLGGHNTLASIEVNKKGEADFNIISSLFGKESKGVTKWILDGKLLSVDKEKAQSYISASALNADATYKNELSSAANILKDFENPTIEGKNHTALSENTLPAEASHDREAMRNEAEQLAEKLHTPVNVVEDANKITHPNKEIEARRRKAKGWYNTTTGEVVVVLANHKDAADVAATISHEVIAHKGLRELVGEERYDEFLDEVYNHLRGDLKREIDDAVGRDFLDDSTQNGDKAKTYEQHRRITIDELFGSLAEKPFEEFSENERNLWQKIKDSVKKLLDRFLEKLKLPKWFEFGDNELRYILWRSNERLERGKEDPIDQAMDIVKREELGLTNEPLNKVSVTARNFEELAERNEWNPKPIRGEEMVDLYDIAPKVTTHDYYLGTKADFKLVKSAENVWDAWEKLKQQDGFRYVHSPKSDSEYLVNDETGEIYRISDHWGWVASCRWSIDDQAPSIFNIGKANIKDFERIKGNYVFTPEAQRREPGHETYLRAKENLERALKDDTYKFTAAARRLAEEKIRSYQSYAEFYEQNHESGDIVYRRNEFGKYIPYREMKHSREQWFEGYISDEEREIVERAQADGSYMKAPNGKPSNLNGKQWAQVRTKAFKNWFGDWEKAARIEKLRKSKPVVISGNEYKGKYELNRDSAKAWIKENLRGEYTVADTGEKVALTKVGANKVTSHGMNNKAHLQSIAIIPQLIRHAIFVEERPNEKSNNKYDSYRYYVCGLKIGTSDYTVKLTIGVKSGKKYYDHALTEIEKGKLLDQINDQAAQKGFTTTGDAPLQSYALSIGKDTKLVSILQTNSSKVVDENGEPMVVYHGTLTNGLRKFSTDFIGSRYSYDEKGFFFINNRRIANDYSISEFNTSRRGEVIDAYVSLRNPLVVNSEWCKKNGLGSNVFKDNDVIEFWDNYQSLMIEESERNDGVIITDGETSMVVSFDPNQIKSATENNGNFSTLDDDIRYREGSETRDIWIDQSMGLHERTTAAAARLANNHRDNKVFMQDAMRAIGANLTDLRKAMRLQKDFDRTTAKRVYDLARILMEMGYLRGLNQQEVSKLLSVMKNSIGKQNIDNDVQKLMDLMVNHQLKQSKSTLESLERIKGSKVNAKGVEVQGALDAEGQAIMAAMKAAKDIVTPCAGKTEEDNGELTAWGQALEDVQERIGSEDNAIAENAALEYQGMMLAQQWFDEIKQSELEEATLRKELNHAPSTTPAEDRKGEAYKEYIGNLKQAIQQNKIDRAQAYMNLVGQLTESLRESIEGAKAFKLREKARISAIQRDANLDMEGRPAGEHYVPDWKARAVNNGFVSATTASLATMDQMLRVFGNKSANGEGYLYNRFERGFVDVRQQEIKGYRGKTAILDAKAAEIFGGKIKKWADLIRYVSGLPDKEVVFKNDGVDEHFTLSQGNLMYIYMVNKMLDGRLKLSKMGLTSDVVEEITKEIDPRLIKLADWMQEDFLVQTRNEYNETHKRVFGASMAAIENYFPLKIRSNARIDKAEDLDNPTKNSGITTTTGSIIKRRRNSLPLDLLNADALNIILDHIAEMEHWNAFVEYNRDLNTLRTYKRFRNGVENMTTIYGSGKKLWKHFNDLCQITTGSYIPPREDLDKDLVNLAKGVTAAKVSFRLFTALKQFLSFPAYFPEVKAVHIAKCLAHPKESWDWCMENLPIFNERWNSRLSGDPRLLKTNMDWKMWRTRTAEIAMRIGMTPNAFVDALTVCIGARAMYMTRKGQYLRDGYTEEVADKKAKQDAEILYNQTQQSSEGAFLSRMQVNRGWVSVLFSIFRNSSMAYTRQLYDATRNLRRNLTPSGRKESIAFMTKQYMNEGFDKAKAEENAKRKFDRQIRKDILRVATFGYILQFAWNLGAYLPYMLFGGDDDEKEAFWQDIFAHSYFGSLEGLTGGDVISQVLGSYLAGNLNPNAMDKDMPLTSDLAVAFKKFTKGDTDAALSDMINLIVQSGIGVNPQSITDSVLAIMDACGDDPALANEATIFIARILQVPQSQIDKLYFDEVGLMGSGLSKYTPAQLAERYARYKVKRGHFSTPWAWDDDVNVGKAITQANREIKERTNHMGLTNLNEAFAPYEEVYQKVDKQMEAYEAAKKTDYVKAANMMVEIQKDKSALDTYQKLKSMDRQLDKMAKRFLSAKSDGERQLYRKMIESYKPAMLKVLQAKGEAAQEKAMDDIGTLMEGFAEEQEKIYENQ